MGHQELYHWIVDRNLVIRVRRKAVGRIVKLNELALAEQVPPHIMAGLSSSEKSPVRILVVKTEAMSIPRSRIVCLRSP